MTPPAPRYGAAPLEAWLAATGTPLPLPPTPRETWTCTLCELGTAVLLDRSDRGIEACDAVFLRALVEATGRATRAEEQEALLLVTPLPAGALDDALARCLTHRSYWVRQNALLCLASLGRPVPRMVEALRDGDNDVRRAAAEAIGRTGLRTGAAALATLPWDADPSVNAARIHALVRLAAWDACPEAETEGEADAASLLGALVRLEGGDEGAMGALLDVVTGPDVDLRRAGCAWLRGHPDRVVPHTEALVASVLAQPALDEQLPLARVLGAAGEDGVDAVVELLEHDDWQLRAWACAALAWAGEAASVAEAALVARLDDDDGDVQREAALALAAAGLRVDDMVARLVRIPTREHGFAARAAAVAPAALGPARVLLGEGTPDPSLLGLLTRRADDKLRGLAALTLSLHEPDLVAPLLEAMARDDGRDVPLAVRRHCAAGLLLAAVPPRELGAVHRLLLCHAGDTAGATGGALDALVPLAGEVATLAVKDGDWQVRIDAMRLLERLGPAAAPYRALVAWQSRHDPDADVRRVAAELADRPWRTTAPGDLLVDILQPPRGAADDQVRAAALRRLADARPALAVPLARGLLTSDSRPLARAAAAVVGRTVDDDDAGRDEVARAVARLDDSGWTVREAACDLLGAVPAAHLEPGLREEVAEALRVRASEDYDDDVRTAATDALRALGVM